MDPSISKINELFSANHSEDPAIERRAFKSRFLVEKKAGKYYRITLQKDVEFGVEDLEAMVEFQKEMGGERLPALFIFHPTSSTNVELMNKISRTKNNPYHQVTGIVITSISQKILGAFYIRNNKPDRIVQLFKTEDEAREWVSQFIQ